MFVCLLYLVLIFIIIIIIAIAIIIIILISPRDSIRARGHAKAGTSLRETQGYQVPEALSSASGGGRGNLRHDADDAPRPHIPDNEGLLPATENGLREARMLSCIIRYSL